MNIIRSKVVELSCIPAVAYKIKLKDGGSGIKIHRMDGNETAFAELSKETGEAIYTPRINVAHFPPEAFEEAVEQLVGCAYSARGKVKVVPSEATDENEIEVPEDEAPGTHEDACANAVDSDEFKAIIDHYTDASGKMNFKLMNKQFIQFASRSKAVADLAANRASEKEILLLIVKNRAAHLAEKREFLPNDEALALIDAIEDIDHRGAFKDLKLHIRKMSAR